MHRPPSSAETQLHDPMRPGRRLVACAVLLTLAAALVRGLARPRRPMWLDEAITLALARLPQSQLLGQLTGREANGGLFTLLLRAVLQVTDLAGIDELHAARGLAALFGVAAVPAFYALARRLAPERVALLAAGLLAVSQFHAYYSIEARGYSLACLLVVLSTGAFVALLDDPRPGRALAFGLLAGLATWAHLFAALVLAAQLVAAPFHPNVRAAARMLATGLALGGALSAAVAVTIIHGDAGQVTWIKPLHLGQVAGVLVGLSGGARLLLVPAAAGLVVTLVALRRGGPGSFGGAMALSWALVPVLLAVAVASLKPLLVPHYLIVALPGYLLVVAHGVASPRRRAWVIAAAVVVLGLAVRELPRDRRADPPRLPFDQVAARLLEVARPGDALVVSHPAIALSLDRELARLGRGSGPERVSPVKGDPLDFRGDQLPSLSERVRGHQGVLFVTYAEQPPSARLRQDLSGDTAVTVDELFAGVRLLRLARSPQR
jgi:mannosyltransferase